MSFLLSSHTIIHEKNQKVKINLIILEKFCIILIET